MRWFHSGDSSRDQVLALDVDLCEQGDCCLPTPESRLRQLVDVQAGQYLHDCPPLLLREPLKSLALALGQLQPRLAEPTFFLVEREVDETQVNPGVALTTMDAVEIGERVKPRRPCRLRSLIPWRVERS